MTPHQRAHRQLPPPTTTSFAVPEETMDSGPDLRWMLGVVRRRWRLVGLGTLLATAAAAALSYREPPTYRANAVIRLGDTRAAIAGGMGSSPTDMLKGRVVDPLLSLAQVLTSRRVAGVVIDSIPVLRLATVGFPLDALDSLTIAPTVERDSVTLHFADGGYTARQGDSTVTASYAERVDLPALSFHLEPRPEAETGTIQILGREVAIDAFVSRIRVLPRENTDVADVAYSSTDPELAKRVVNRSVRTFQQVNTQGARQESQLRRQFLEAQLEENEAQLTAAQRALSEFRADEQLYSSRERLSAEQATIASMGVRERELDADLTLYRGALRDLRQGQTDNLAGLLAAPSVAANPAIRESYERLGRMSAARDSLVAGPFGAAATNPDVQRLDSLIIDSRVDLTATVQSLIANTEARRAGIDALRGQNAAAFRNITGKEVTEAQLVLQVEALIGISNQLREEYQKARVSEAVEVGQVEILDEAVTPRHPVGISPFRKTLFGALVGFCVAAGLALLLEQMNTSIRRRGQVRAALKVPELGIVPRGVALNPGRTGRWLLPGGSRRRQARTTGGTLADLPLVALDLQSGGAEAYRLIRTNLLFLGGDEAIRSIMVTSTAPGDGKSTVSMNLAVTFAKQGISVLLIDCDLRRGRLHEVFGIPRRPGLSEVLQGRAVLAEVVHSSPIEQLAVVAMGTPPETPAELQGGAMMRDVLADAGARYDLVILDSPPVLSTADASILATLADAVVLVVRAGHTDQGEAQSALRQLDAVGANVVGAVLNDQDATVDAREHYYYASYYGPPSS